MYHRLDSITLTRADEKFIRIVIDTLPVLLRGCNVQDKIQIFRMLSENLDYDSYLIRLICHEQVRNTLDQGSRQKGSRGRASHFTSKIFQCKREKETFENLLDVQNDICDISSEREYYVYTNIVWMFEKFL